MERKAVFFKVRGSPAYLGLDVFAANDAKWLVIFNDGIPMTAFCAAFASTNYHSRHQHVWYSTWTPSGNEEPRLLVSEYLMGPVTIMCGQVFGYVDWVLLVILWILRICELHPQILLLLLSTCFAESIVVSGVLKGNQGLHIRGQLPSDVDWHLYHLAKTSRLSMIKHEHQ